MAPPEYITITASHWPRYTGRFKDTPSLIVKFSVVDVYYLQLAICVSIHKNETSLHREEILAAVKKIVKHESGKDLHTEEELEEMYDSMDGRMIRNNNTAGDGIEGLNLHYIALSLDPEMMDEMVTLMQRQVLRRQYAGTEVCRSLRPNAIDGNGKPRLGCPSTGTLEGANLDEPGRKYYAVIAICLGTSCSPIN